MKGKFKFDFRNMLLMSFCLLLVLQSVIKIGADSDFFKSDLIESIVDLETETESESEENSEENKLELETDLFFGFNPFFYSYRKNNVISFLPLNYSKDYVGGIDFPPEI